MLIGIIISSILIVNIFAYINGYKTIKNLINNTKKVQVSNLTNKETIQQKPLVYNQNEIKKIESYFRTANRNGIERIKNINEIKKEIIELFKDDPDVEIDIR